MNIGRGVAEGVTEGKVKAMSKKEVHGVDASGSLSLSVCVVVGMCWWATG